MIPEWAIMEWNAKVPWSSLSMVEQDLVISRALVSIYSDDFLRANLAFRGGTALHKLYFQPQPRYSEDIDLVQINPGPIKSILQRLGEVLDWLPNRSTAQKRHSNKIYFKFDSELFPIERMRLKIEINCFEHFCVMGFAKVPFRVENSWFTGEAELTTYHVEEMLGTKMRALYQRRKGRDLFDLYTALSRRENDIGKILECFQRYIEFVAPRMPSYKEYVMNLSEKMESEDFLTDVRPLLRSEINFDPQKAYDFVCASLLERLPGQR